MLSAEVPWLRSFPILSWVGEQPASCHCHSWGLLNMHHVHLPAAIEGPEQQCIWLRSGIIHEVVPHITLIMTSKQRQPDTASDVGAAHRLHVQWGGRRSLRNIPPTQLCDSADHLDRDPAGWRAATEWGWVLSPALGYVGQGMIMGPRTAVSMLAGALAGWACLGPVAHAKGTACPLVVHVLSPGIRTGIRERKTEVLTCMPCELAW